jgi:hypothetical protein
VSNGSGVSGWLSDFRALPLGERVGIVLQALQVVAIVLGGGWFLLQYRMNVENTAREESLKYAVRAHKADLIDGLGKMQKPFMDHALRTKLASAIKTSFQAKDICAIDSFYRDQLSAAYYANEWEKETFFNALNGLVAFHTSLAICANSGTCDLETACNFFFADAKQMLTRHCTYFDRVTLSYGYSPVLDIDHFLRSCTALERFEVPTLTYCEDIKNASGKDLSVLYQTCQ